MSLPPLLLHGTFHITIMQASDLTDENRHSGAAPKFLRKMIEGVEDAIKLGRGSSKLYASVEMEMARVARTRIVDTDPCNPVWNESFHVYCAFHVANVVVSVKDDNPMGATTLGRAKIPVADILSGDEIDDWFDLCHDDGRFLRGGSKIHLRMQFYDISSDPFVGRGATGSKFSGVPYTFFPQRNGCKLTLYQDAHVSDSFLPPISVAKDRGTYEPQRLWEDIYDAIAGAQHLIYIAGWSVYADVELIRDDANGRRQIEGSLRLGELLKKKASEGVTVDLLVWDDRTSVGSWKKDGLMATHDEDTAAYFRNSEVNCVLCPRNPDNALSFAQGIQIGAMFTHHQKIVVVDAPIMSSRSSGSGDGTHSRRIVSFVGGIDLCDGRYDTPSHSLFRTLNGVHARDFHQPNFPGASLKKGGPREPWHDIHCRIEGEAAWDVLRNFEQRWKKQGKQGKLVDLEEVTEMEPASPTTDPEDPGSWNVQVFRSIDAGAAHGFPDSPEEAAMAGLVSGKESIIDRSIQDAYIHAIRRAKSFVYIENQYFLGSCASWDGDQDCGATQLIPIELALKIASKIEAGESFCAYIVVPMWPEGVPESASVQAILGWMHRTMAMMYKIVAKALEAKGLAYERSPRDYLAFYCLGNREMRIGDEYIPPNTPEADTSYQLAQDNRRFMIYVHSKMMIVDDEYIIVGSANINQRSMDGARDSEIAMGAYQPKHTAAAPTRLPKGEVHRFRLALWYEHLGRMEEVFLQPWILECMRKVNGVAEELWDKFVQEEALELPGHLLMYPVAVGSDGSVQEMPGRKCFPDTRAPILGAAKDGTLPAILTT